MKHRKYSREKSLSGSVYSKQADWFEAEPSHVTQRVNTEPTVPINVPDRQSHHVPQSARGERDEKSSQTGGNGLKEENFIELEASAVRHRWRMGALLSPDHSPGVLPRPPHSHI